MILVFPSVKDLPFVVSWIGNNSFFAFLPLIMRDEDLGKKDQPSPGTFSQFLVPPLPQSIAI